MGQWSNSVPFSMGAIFVLFIIATIATDKFTLMAYTFAKPKKPNMPKICRDFKHSFVSSTETICHTLEIKNTASNKRNTVRNIAFINLFVFMSNLFCFHYNVMAICDVLDL